MKIKILEVEYSPVNGASPASLWYDLRNIVKEEMPEVYYTKDKHCKNFGCYLFGQPETWASILSINNYQELDCGFWSIDIHVDKYRLDKDIEVIQHIVKSACNLLRERGWIRDIRLV